MGYRGEIGLDMDGVQCRTHVPILRAVNQELKTHFTHKNVTNYHFVSNKVLEITGDEAKAERLEGLWFEPDVLRQVPPYRTRILALKMLQLMGIYSRTSTSRFPNSRTITEEWYREHWKEMLSGGRLHMLTENSTMDGSAHKLATIEQYQLPLFFEDQAQTIRYFRAQGYVGGKLVDHPWNRGPENEDLDDSRVFGTIGMLGTIWQACRAGQL